MIVVDTSIWIDHFRGGNVALTRALEAGVVLMHLFVIGEIACGKLTRRGEILALLAAMPQAPVATHAEAMQWVERQALAGDGIGWVDVHLLASTALAPGARLWTRDRRLEAVALAAGLLYEPAAAG